MKGNELTIVNFFENEVSLVIFVRVDICVSLSTHALYYLRVVHVAPPHPAVQTHTPGLVHVPPFEHIGKQAAKYIKHR